MASTHNFKHRKMRERMIVLSCDDDESFILRSMTIYNQLPWSDNYYALKCVHTYVVGNNIVNDS